MSSVWRPFVIGAGRHPLRRTCGWPPLYQSKAKSEWQLSRRRCRPGVVAATRAPEDHRFWQHPGVEPQITLIRAAPQAVGRGMRMVPRAPAAPARTGFSS